ncbi:pantoate--beta-alanine ligase [Microaerobacter geothermalis]|uniref:pantoate--beta-alanine ligase n=1 Tax=Microaerobacter geothermalis TaxID=674972 RepID=UPI001F46524A|nr:pantoate--beta-alanine ligase [Microaerobacter geothermalis]MCF6093349.1 pantoate--beta-alanine ligase [Microaerobacter geothermalis]
MKIVHDIKSLREFLQDKKNIGLVPTMGYLHEGHLSLVNEAKKISEHVVMSIFVNPLQFGPNEDFDRYPRDFDRDCQMAQDAGADVVFAPSVSEMYPDKSFTTVHVSSVTERLCGASRPGHFDGVATVVSKLFHIVQPTYAFFGLKDAQQVAVIQQMVNDLNFPVKIIPCPIIREKDGLALSSRNVYLSPEEREQALVLSQSLKEARRFIEEGERDIRAVINHIRSLIGSKPLAEIEYVEVLSYPSLQTLKRLEGRFIIALAVKFGKTRLIDNLIMSLQEVS